MNDPIPMLLWCPECGARHIDEGEFATKGHHTHACQNCGHVWRPAITATTGVQFLPGFKNAPALASTQPTLFPTRKPNGILKHALARVLSIANAGVQTHLWRWREEFYGLKRALLERYANRDGTDWQEITRPCWGCSDCRDWDDDLYYCGRRDGFACNGSKVYSRKWIPLSRWKIGRCIFHTPGPAVFEKPSEQVTIRGVIAHREVDAEAAKLAFLQLCLCFDRDLFCRVCPEMFLLAQVGY